MNSRAPGRPRPIGGPSDPSRHGECRRPQTFGGSGIRRRRSRSSDQRGRSPGRHEARRASERTITSRAGFPVFSRMRNASPIAEGRSLEPRAGGTSARALSTRSRSKLGGSTIPRTRSLARSKAAESPEADTLDERPGPGDRPFAWRCPAPLPTHPAGTVEHEHHVAADTRGRQISPRCSMTRPAGRQLQNGLASAKGHKRPVAPIRATRSARVHRGLSRRRLARAELEELHRADHFTTGSLRQFKRWMTVGIAALAARPTSIAAFRTPRPVKFRRFVGLSLGYSEWIMGVWFAVVRRPPVARSVE